MVEVRPVQWWLAQYLSGYLPASKIPPAVLSWSDFFIYQGALEIILVPDREARRQALDKVPDQLRNLVQNEIARLWPMRRELRQRQEMA